MRYGAGHKQDAHGRILAAAGRGFRRFGYGGSGVDALAKEAGVTSGAFYGHFPSKSDAFREAAVAGLSELRLAIEQLRAEHPDTWLQAFVEFYLSQKRTCELGESCGLQSLSGDVMRAGAETKRAYEEELCKVVDCVSKGLIEGTAAERRKTAWSILAVLSGAVTLARACEDAKLGSQVANAAKAAALALAGGTE